MNIFFLDMDPVKAAQYHCDKHVVKMILETAQILCTVMRTKLGIEYGYQPTHNNHPCVLWAAQNWVNFEWLRNLGLALCSEYSYRYGKTHKCRAIIEGTEWPWLLRVPTMVLFGKPTEMSYPALCMPDVYKGEHPVESYRNYYLGAKTGMLKYTNREVPDWIQGMGLGEHK